MNEYSDEQIQAVLKYMKLRIDGYGWGLTEKEISFVNELTEEQWKEVEIAILELGGTLASYDANDLELCGEN